MALTSNEQVPTNCVVLPALPILKGAKGIYTGKYNDHYPDVLSVGK